MVGKANENSKTPKLIKIEIWLSVFLSDTINLLCLHTCVYSLIELQVYFHHSNSFSFCRDKCWSVPTSHVLD